MSWRDHIKVHPACELFPPMSDEELKVLAEDIKKHGMKVPIVIQRGKTSDKPVLMDGRNRLEAIERFTDIPIKVNPLTRAIAEHHKYLRVVLKGGDPHAVVGSLNIHRRHLTTKQKRELIGKLLKSDPTKSNRQIAKMTKSSHPTVATERAKLEATGDVVKVSTSIDTKGRQQPARKAKRAAEAAAAELGDACSERSRAEQSAEARQQPNRSADHHAEPAQLPDQTANERKALYAAAEMVPTEHSPPSAPSMDDEEWTEKDEKIGQQNLATVFRMNCAAALQVVTQGYTGPINRRVLAAVRQTADAWNKLADELEAAAELAPEAAA